MTNAKRTLSMCLECITDGEVEAAAGAVDLLERCFEYPGDRIAWQRLQDLLWDADRPLATAALLGFIDRVRVQRPRRQRPPWREINTYTGMMVWLLGFTPAGWPGNDTDQAQEEPEANRARAERDASGVQLEYGP